MWPETTGARATLLAGVAAVVVLAALLWLVGVGDVLAALTAADLPEFGLTVLVAAVWVLAWSNSLFGVCEVLDVPATRRESVLLFSTVQFANNVSPFSVFGGEALAALVVARRTGVDYGTALATVASTDALNFVPGPALALAGLAAVAVTAAFPVSLAGVAVSLLAVVAALAAGGVLAWRYRRRVASRASGAVAALLVPVALVLPGFTPPGRSTVEQRLLAIVGHLETVARSRHLGRMVAVSTVGWVLFASTLWLALRSLGEPTPLVVALFAVPAVSVTDVLPLPGGLGSVEAALVVVLVAAGVAAPTATAAVLVHRVATLWLPVAAGGAAVAYLQVDR